MSEIRVNNIRNEAGTGAPSFPNGATVVGTLTGTATTATTAGYATTAGIATVAQGLTGTPNITVGTIGATSLNASGVVTATTFVGALTGNATGLTGTPNITVGNATVSGDLTVQGTTTTIDTVNLVVEDKNIGIGSTSTPSNTTADGAGLTIFGGSDGDKTLTYNNTKKAFETNVAWATTETRFISVAEKHVITSGNTVSLTYNGASSNIGLATNPTGNITLNVTGIPTSSDFDSHTLTFSVFVNQTGTARSCTAVTLNGFSPTIRWAGGSLANAIAGVTTTNGMDIYSFTGINTIGSASTTANYYLLGVVNGGYR